MDKLDKKKRHASGSRSVNLFINRNQKNQSQMMLQLI